MLYNNVMYRRKAMRSDTGTVLIVDQITYPSSVKDEPSVCLVVIVDFLGEEDGRFPIGKQLYVPARALMEI